MGITWRFYTVPLRQRWVIKCQCGFFCQKPTLRKLSTFYDIRFGRWYWKVLQKCYIGFGLTDGYRQVACVNETLFLNNHLFMVYGFYKRLCLKNSKKNLKINMLNRKVKSHEKVGLDGTIKKKKSPMAKNKTAVSQRQSTNWKVDENHASCFNTLIFYRSCTSWLLTLLRYQKVWLKRTLQKKRRETLKY